MTRLHRRYGDPVTIRTYWTEEPMVLFSDPDAVREVFRLDPAIAPAGQSWEFLRPFAGPHSILLLDGEPHLRERRLMAAPFHGERMRAFAPMVAELARREFAGWSGRVVALERMRELTLEIILRIVFGADDSEARRLRDAIEGTLAGVRSMPRMLSMALIQRDLGPWSPWGRFRVAVERFDALLVELLAQRRAAPRARAGLGARDAARAARPGRKPAHQIASCAISSWRCSSADMTARPRRSPGRSNGSCVTRPCMARIREGDPAYLDAVVKEVLRARPPLTIAPRLLLEPARIAGRWLPAGVQVAACLWLAMRRDDLWAEASAFEPERWLDGSPHDPMSWIPFGGGVRRCAGAPFAEMELREVLRAAAGLTLGAGPARGRARPAQHAGGGSRSRRES